MPDFKGIRILIFEVSGFYFKSTHPDEGSGSRIKGRMAKGMLRPCEEKACKISVRRVSSE